MKSYLHIRLLSLLIASGIIFGAVTVTRAEGEKPEDLRAQIEKVTQEVRGLQFKNPVTYKTMTREEFLPWAKNEFDEQYGKGGLRNQGRALSAIGLLPEDTDLEETLMALLGAQAAAFYDYKTRTLYTFKEMPDMPLLQWSFLSHELTHALQDQHYDFQSYPELKLKDNEDRQRAFQAVFEGDASIIMPKVISKGMGVPLGPSAKIPHFPGADMYVQNMLVFPYREGADFVQTLYNRTNSFEWVDKAYKNIPHSTEQILHPEKYLDKDQLDVPREINIPRLDSPDWQFLDSNVLGEFSIRELLHMHLGNDAAEQAAQAAAGWGGDRYNAYVRKLDDGKEAVAVHWIIAWDTEKDAGEFIDSLVESYKKRFADLTMTQEANDGVKLYIAKTSNWQIQFTRQGDTVTLLQAPPQQFHEFAQLIEALAKK